MLFLCVLRHCHLYLITICVELLFCMLLIIVPCIGTTCRFCVFHPFNCSIDHTCCTCSSVCLFPPFYNQRYYILLYPLVLNFYCMPILLKNILLCSCSYLSCRVSATALPPAVTPAPSSAAAAM